MKFTCVLPDHEGTLIEFSRSRFFGSVSIKANGRKAYSLSAFNPRVHFSTTLTREYKFSLPGSSPRHVCITKERPLILAGVRASRYRVAFNGEHIGAFKG
jgi:hypothetical protein